MVTVDLVVRDGQRRFLLVKRNQNNLTWRGMWATPGGRVFRNEKILDAAHRVLLRETSLNIPRSKFKFRGFHEQFAPKEHGVTMIFSEGASTKDKVGQNELLGALVPCERYTEIAQM